MKFVNLPDRNEFVIYPTHDFGFKALMGHRFDPQNTLIKDLLKSMFDKEFEIIEFKEREMNPAHLSGKTIRLDLRVKCEGVIFNLEMQMFPTGSEAERALYYACGLVYTQNMTGKSHKALESVSQVFLLGRNINTFDFPSEYYEIIGRKYGRLLTDKFKISIINLERVVEEINDYSQMDDLQKWCLFLRKGHLSYHEGIQVLMEEERFRKAEMIMREVNQDELLKDAAFQRMKDELDHFTRMSNAREEGLAEGLEKGRKEGIEFTEARHQMENEQRIVQMLNDGLDKTLIMKYFNVTLEEIEVLR